MIVINVDKAKGIAHEVRRAKRAEEFAPLDEQIMKQLPGTDAAAVEAQRQAVRDKYVTIQESIEAATETSDLKAVIESL